MDSTINAPPIISSSDHKPSRGGWNAAIFIIFVEMAERFAFYGLSGNLITYLTNVFHEPTATAAKNVNTWIGVSFMFPLLGAFLADSYLGRFKTIILSSIIYFMDFGMILMVLGMAIFSVMGDSRGNYPAWLKDENKFSLVETEGMVSLTLSVSVIPLQKRKAAFFIALYILSIGEGGHKPSVQTFAADQFDEDSPKEKMAKSSFFNWWYMGIITGAMAAILVVIYVQDNVGWAIGFGILAAALAVAFAVFLLGIRKYRRQGPRGSPFTTVAQVFVAAARKCRVDDIRDGRGVCYGDTTGGAILMKSQSKTLARTKHFRFLDKAMIIDDIDASSKSRDPWRLCSLNQVEEMKLVLGLIPIWLTCLYINVVLAQMPTYFTQQGRTMERSIGPHFKIPPASLQCLTGFTVIIILPIYDRVFVPAARRLTGNPTGITMLQRIGIGLFLSVLNMVVSALVEAKRVAVARDHNLLDKSPNTLVPITVWWLLPQYTLIGMSDVFAIVGMQHLFYDQMPEAMRSLGAAAYISNAGVGNFISTAIISIVEARSKEKWLENNLNRSHLDYFYFLLAGLGALNLCVYIVVAKRYVYKKVEENDACKEKEMDSIGHPSQHV